MSMCAAHQGHRTTKQSAVAHEIKEGHAVDKSAVATCLAIDKIDRAEAP